jgi:hypothetical protein
MAGGFAVNGKASFGWHRGFKEKITWWLMFGYDIGISAIVVSLLQFYVIYYRGSSASK